MSYQIPASLANQAVEACEKVITGLMADNKRLQEKINELEKEKAENREAYLRVYDAYQRLINPIK